MIAVDTNLLVYAHRTEMPDHAPAHRALRGLVESRQPWGLPHHVAVEFVGVVSRTGRFAEPTPGVEAWSVVDALVTRHGGRLLFDDRASWEILGELLADVPRVGPMVHDARIAALCIANGVSELWSCDRDYSRFPRLKVRNPLAPDR